MEHFRSSPLSALSSAALKGDRVALEAAVSELPRDIVVAFAAAASKSLSSEHDNEEKEAEPAMPASLAHPITGGSAGRGAGKGPEKRAGGLEGGGGGGRGGGRAAPTARSKAAGGGGEGGDDEVCGPTPSDARAVIDSLASAGASWAAWRLGMLWTRKAAEATGMEV